MQNDAAIAAAVAEMLDDSGLYGTGLPLHWGQIADLVRNLGTSFELLWAGSDFGDKSLAVTFIMLGKILELLPWL